MELTGKLSKDTSKLAHSFNHENYRNFGNFKFWNGDKYEGQYLANKNQFSIVRDGRGTYWTNQSIYYGSWCKDLMEEADEIIFPDKSIFTGTLNNMRLEGPGTYKFKEGIEIQGNLENNHFVGDIELKDPNGHCWKALNDTDEDEIIFHPVQPFWQSVLEIGNIRLPDDELKGEDDFFP